MTKDKQTVSWIEKGVGGAALRLKINSVVISSQFLRKVGLVENLSEEVTK